MGRKCISGTRQCSAILACGKTASRRALVVLIGLGIAIGCATPEERYRTLSIIFDDVPLPESMRPPPVVEEVEIVEPVGPEVSKDPTFEWVVHKPDCKECHTSRETQVAYADAPELCWDCHRKEEFAGRFQHGPFAEGACLYCHTPHKSQVASLLVSPPEELCASCHDASTFAELEQHRENEGEDCIRCHSPHSSASRHLLKPEPTTTLAPDHGPESGSGARP